MSTIDITVVQGTLPLSDPTLVLRVTLDDGTVLDLSGVELQSVLDASVGFTAQSTVTADPAVTMDATAAVSAQSTMTAAAELAGSVSAAVDVTATSTMTADATLLTNSQVQVSVVRGGLRYNEAYTLRVTLDDGTVLDLTGVQLEPVSGAAAVDVVDPVTTEDSIFYQVQSGTPATGQQIWHDDSPNTVVNPNGTFSQTVVRDFQAQVWDVDYTWGALTTIQTQEIVYVDAAVAISATSSMTAGGELGGELLAATAMSAQSTVTADAGVLMSVGTAVTGQSTMTADGTLGAVVNAAVAMTAASTMTADGELITGVGAAFAATSTMTADAAMDVTAGAAVTSTATLTADPALTMEAGVAFTATSAMTAAGEASASLDAGVNIVVQSSATAAPAMDLAPSVALVATSVMAANPSMDLLTQAAFAAVSSVTFDATGAVEVERGYLEAYSVHIYPALSCYTKVEPK